MVTVEISTMVAAEIVLLLLLLELPHLDTIAMVAVVMELSVVVLQAEVSEDVMLKDGMVTQGPVAGMKIKPETMALLSSLAINIETPIATTGEEIR